MNIELTLYLHVTKTKFTQISHDLRFELWWPEYICRNQFEKRRMKIIQISFKKDNYIKFVQAHVSQLRAT